MKDFKRVLIIVSITVACFLITGICIKLYDKHSEVPTSSAEEDIKPDEYYEPKPIVVEGYDLPDFNTMSEFNKSHSNLFDDTFNEDTMSVTLLYAFEYGLASYCDSNSIQDTFTTNVSTDCVNGENAGIVILTVRSANYTIEITYDMSTEKVQVKEVN